MVEGMLRNIEAGESFIVWDDKTPAATITVDTWANPDLWTEVERAESALYLLKMTAARAYAGRGRGASARWLRLDVWTTNDALQRYYLDRGFTHVRTVVLEHNPSGALFQRPAQRVATPRLREVDSHVARSQV